MESTNSLDEALKNVNLLDDLALSDEQQVIEAPAASITYNPNFDTNFEDSEAFITCNSKYLEEAAMHRGLVSSNYLTFIGGFFVVWYISGCYISRFV
jgi:cytoplasmic FMR1 interacting protein